MLLLPFGGREQPAFSYDSPYYVWRTRAVATVGLDVLLDVPTGGVPERPGFPVVGAFLGAVTGSDALVLTVVLRAVAAIAIGLAAGALAFEALGSPAWTFGAFVFGLGTSAAVVGMAVGSLDQLLVEALLIAAAAVVPLALVGRRGLVATGLLIAAAVATHWVFAGLFLLLLVGLAGSLLAVPGMRRTGEADREIGRGRLLQVVAAAAIGTVVALLLIPALPSHLPPATGGKGNVRLDAYELPLLLPLAALGLVLGLRLGGSTARKTTLLLAGLWAATVPLAFVVSWSLPAPLKLFRVAPFALGVPLLATLGSVTLASLVGSRLRGGGVAAGVVILVAGLTWSMGSPASSFTADGGSPGRVAERMAQARTAGRYLTEVRTAGRPVVFVTRAAPRLLDRVVRSAVPPSLITDTWVFVGEVADLAVAASSPDPNRLPLSEESRAWLTETWPPPPQVLGRGPIVIRIGPPAGHVETATRLAPGVAIVRGPMPSPASSPQPSVSFAWARLLGLTALAVVVLAAAGGGWARWMLDVSVPAAIGLAPAFGVAVLVVAGTVAGRLGVPLGGRAGIVVLLATAGAGWTAPLLRTAFPRIHARREERARAEAPR